MNYTELRNMPLPELKHIHSEAARISDQRERELEKTRHG